MARSGANVETLERLEAALSGDVLARLAELRGWTPRALRRLHIGWDGQRAVLPVFDSSGDLVGFLRYQPDPARRAREPKMRSDPGTARDLFPPPEMLGDEEIEGGYLWLVEGEPDAIRLWSVGVPAVGVPGAQNWRDEWAARFSGRRTTVVVCFDSDEPGRENAERAANALAANGVAPRLVDVDPESNDGRDVTDLLDGLDEEASQAWLYRLAAGAEPYLPAEPSGPVAFRVRTAPEMMALPDPPDEARLLGPLVTRGGRTIVVGDTGHGKTTIGLQMLSAIVRGEEMLGYEGQGVGPALVLDLEQGLLSIKRGLREARLDEQEDLLYVSVPDGLALDRDPAHLAALEAILAERAPVAVLLDPYYKAHRADEPNAERPIIDLMRQLDALRAAYGFALILPAHPRKAAIGRETLVRTLTIHDVAGSGAIVRGAELVVGIERVAPGRARLRYLKDRDGDQGGVVVSLSFSRESGFAVLDEAEETAEDVRQKILAAAPEWLTAAEWSKKIGSRRPVVQAVLEDLADDPESEVVFAKGPEGRHGSAKCFSVGWPDDRDNLGQPSQMALEEGCPDDRDKPGQPSPAKAVGDGLSPLSPVRGERAGTTSSTPSDERDNLPPSETGESLSREADDDGEDNPFL